MEVGGKRPKGESENLAKHSQRLNRCNTVFLCRCYVFRIKCLSSVLCVMYSLCVPRAKKKIFTIVGHMSTLSYPCVTGLVLLIQNCLREGEGSFLYARLR